MNFQNLIKSIENGTVYDIDGVRLVHLTNCFNKDDVSYLTHSYTVGVPEVTRNQWSSNKKEWPFALDSDSDDYKNLLIAVNKKLSTNFDHYVARTWQEEDGHYMAPHIDNDMVSGSMQIYLPSTAAENTGTTFFGKNLTMQFKFIQNTGYLCSNPRRISHGTGVPVNFNEFRRSIYFIFRNL
jgi:hypothetical protein